MKVRPLDRAADLAAVEELIASRSAVSARDALDENKHRGLRRAAPGHHGIVATAAGDVIGYAHVAPARAGWEVGVVVAGTDAVAETYAQLTAAAVAAIPPGGRVDVWSWDPPHDAALAALGAAEGKTLHQMRRPLPAPVEALPPGVELRPFRDGRDEEVWLAAHNAAFELDADHGAWGREQLMERLQREWFDPTGFLLAWVGLELAGFCWTKVHAGAVGEIYIIGVVPGFRGKGLGTALVTAGLAHLAGARHCREGMLYVDGANGAALATYRRLGFSVTATGRCYRATPPD